MKKRKGSWLLAGGVALIALCLVFVAVFYLRLYTGEKHCAEVTAKLEAVLPPRTPGMPGAYPNTSMPVLEIDGENYTALVEIPAFGLTLPVADEWDEGTLTRSPARFCGSVYNGTLVVGGVDTQSQFAFCGQIDNGAAITVTDMTGAQFAYKVDRVDRSDRAELEWLQADSDLTLFCRELYGTGYIAVRCVAAYG